jgi:hypothetical protein
MLNAFAAWLYKTPVTSFLETAAWAVPTIQTLHILSIAVVFGGATFITLRIFGLLETGQPVMAVLDRFMPPMALAIAVLFATGCLLVASEPNRAMFRTMFWVKMTLVAVAALLTWSQRWVVLPRYGGAITAVGVRGRALAAVCVALWVAVIFAGRWIGYASSWPGAPA